MRAVAHRRLIDVLRDWFRHLFKPTIDADHDSAQEFERFFGQ